MRLRMTTHQAYCLGYGFGLAKKRNWRKDARISAEQHAFWTVHEKAHLSHLTRGAFHRGLADGLARKPFRES